ncbi:MULTISPECIES: helix-turn-helix domain-containing protein [unclassified Pseudoalteromonas]|uniref:helix-turn-helix domain-containing protein n=1 Tax=Pseudoalteromonas sp. Of5H-6 TaxID=3136664 RepID=UPI001F26BF1E|nr:helix-turn-helix domain-containing protein [Pseudoalteromonas sp. DL2-H1]MCF2828111.1 helix-turn-helix domain-containing protein [Pseudoalteromonas sp. OF5H-5]MCF2831722.1 helix-turn-helix domain-containing protein [Pseudoalteromonas sp. DL2-H6]MCF2924106.1 helix-turn-helix domain-containing protein [Pseudoalteromonas sp. DL2-H1]
MAPTAAPLSVSLQLLESQKSIQEIAIELGYASDSAFVQAFKKLFNQTPRKYRIANLQHNVNLF